MRGVVCRGVSYRRGGERDGEQRDAEIKINRRCLRWDGALKYGILASASLAVPRAKAAGAVGDTESCSSGGRGREIARSFAFAWSCVSNAPASADGLDAKTHDFSDLSLVIAL